MIHLSQGIPPCEPAPKGMGNQTGETVMARIELKDAGLSRMMIEALDERMPQLGELFTSVVTIARLEKGATDARKDATAELKAAGLDGESVFSRVKNTAAELAFRDNGQGAEKGISGVTVMQYFAGRAAAEGLPDNTGKAYARLTGQMVEALRRKLVDRDTLLAWSRPEAQNFFSTEEAQARNAVKAEFGEMLKGCTEEYAKQLSEHLAAFKYQRPDDAKPGTAAWEGKAVPKPKKGEPAVSRNEAGEGDEDLNRDEPLAA